MVTCHSGGTNNRSLFMSLFLFNHVMMLSFPLTLWVVYITIHPSSTALSRAQSWVQHGPASLCVFVNSFQVCLFLVPCLSYQFCFTLHFLSLFFWIQWFACNALTSFTCVSLRFSSFFIYYPISTKFVPLLPPLLTHKTDSSMEQASSPYQEQIARLTH